MAPPIAPIDLGKFNPKRVYKQISAQQCDSRGYFALYFALVLYTVFFFLLSGSVSPHPYFLFEIPRHLIGQWASS